MVHAIRAPSSPFASRPHPDAKRIAGLAAAIALNTALLMLLLVPMRAPPTLSLPEVIRLQWIQHKPIPPAPPVKVPVTRTQPRPPTEVMHPQQVVQPMDPPVIVDHGSEPVVEQAAVDNTPPATGMSTTPLPGVRLEYADAPPPAYPRDALRAGIQGTVLLQVLVDVDGRPLQVDVQRSSGDYRLDIAARRQVLQHWRFRPAMKEGHAVQAIGLVPIAFNLTG
jgi:protein TonB